MIFYLVKPNRVLLAELVLIMRERYRNFSWFFLLSFHFHWPVQQRSIVAPNYPNKTSSTFKSSGHGDFPTFHSNEVPAYQVSGLDFIHQTKVRPPHPTIGVQFNHDLALILSLICYLI